MDVNFKDIVFLLGLVVVFSFGGCRGGASDIEVPPGYLNSRAVKFIEQGSEGNNAVVGQNSQDFVSTDQTVFSNLYKTPSGEKYHTADCYLVNNVSLKLDGKDDILRHGLSPCKRCKPPAVGTIQGVYSPANKAVGESTLVRCSGKTQKGKRCKRKTRLGNGYCFQHGG